MTICRSCCLCCLLFICIFFFFKHKTAYEVRISDWSSDVCSSDLLPEPLSKAAALLRTPRRRGAQQHDADQRRQQRRRQHAEFGLAHQLAAIAECEAADEQAHRETDAAQQCNAVQLPPRGLRRQMRMTALDREPRKAEYTDLLADEQAGGDAEWHRLHQRDRKSTRLNSSH